MSIGISVIIPYYNTPLGLFEQCMKSILNQSYKDNEIIIVDDGSDEKLANWIDNRYGEKDNIRIYHIENSGVSYARNYALAHSNGKYVCFLDSDDYVAPWMLEDMFKGVKSNNADVCISYLKKVKDYNYQFKRNNSIEILKSSKKKDRDSLFEVILRGLNISETKLGYLSCGPCSILVRSEIAKEIEFPIGIHYMEDVIWNYKVFQKAKIVVKLNETLYAYMYNQESATRKFDVDIVNKRVLALEEIANIVSNDKVVQKWFALRTLSNISIICHQISAGFKNEKFSFVKRLKYMYGVSYIKKWRKLITSKNAHEWENKYKIKYLLYKLRILPLLYLMIQECKKKKI